MKFLAFVAILLASVSQPIVVNASQIALRTRPSVQLYSRSFPNDAALFDPTDEESFYVSGG